MNDMDEAGHDRARAGGSQEHFASFGLTVILTAYLLFIAIVACGELIAIFPAPSPATSAAIASTGAVATSPAQVGGLSFGDIVLPGHNPIAIRADQGLVLLALFAGVLGSFMHASQSLAAYVGNQQLRPSWALWYALRPPTGGILGLLFYFILRAGLIPASTSGSSESVSPYGVVAFGALAGWFSKRTTDKLAEVFETLFRTTKDLEYKDKLSDSGKPKITKVVPAVIDLAAHAANDVAIIVAAEGLAPGAWASLDGLVIPTQPLDATRLSCIVPKSLTLAAGKKLKLAISNPPPPNAPRGTKGESSDAVEIDVQ